MITDSLTTVASSHLESETRLVTLRDAQPGGRYQVVHIMFSLIREYLASLGIKEGDVLTCRGNGALVVRFSRDGQDLYLGDGYGWFVQVLPLAEEA